MIAFQLSDINEGPLREAAVQLSIANASTMSKADLIAAIKQKASPNQALAFAPMTQNSQTDASTTQDNKTWRTPAVIIATVSLLIAIISSIATWWGTTNTVNKFYRDYEDDKKRSWQAVRVYEIICRNTNTHEKWTGLTIDEIRSLYAADAVSTTSVTLSKNDLTVEALERVLYDLTKEAFVARTYEDKYVAARIRPLAKDCATRPTTEVVEHAVFQILRTESGKYTVEKLAEKTKNETKLSSEDVYASLNCMIANQKVLLDANRLVCAASDKPVTPVPVPVYIVPQAMEPPKAEDKAEKKK